jgi:hypothetical protein
MDHDELNNRFKYHPPRDVATANAHEYVRASAYGLAMDINDLVPDGREKSLAITKLEEALMWANAAIARRS